MLLVQRNLGGSEQSRVGSVAAVECADLRDAGGYMSNLKRTENTINTIKIEERLVLSLQGEKQTLAVTEVEKSLLNDCIVALRNYDSREQQYAARLHKLEQAIERYVYWTHAPCRNETGPHVYENQAACFNTLETIANEVVDHE